MRIKLLLLALFCPIVLFGQKSRKIALPLNRDNRMQIPAVSKIEVLVQLSDTNSVIGFDFTNDDEVVKLISDTTMRSWLSLFFQRRYGPFYKSNTVNRLVLTVNQLRIQVSRDNNSFAKLRAEVWLADELNDAYYPINKLDTLIVAPGSKPEQVVADVFDDLLKRSTNVSIDRKNRKSLAQIKSGSQKIAPSVLLADNVRHEQGVFLNFSEFQRSSPSIRNVVAFPDETDLGSLRVFEVLPDSSKREVTEFWGILMDNELYVQEKKELIPVELQSRTIMISAFVDTYFRKNQAYFRRLLGHKTEAPIFNTKILCTESNAIATSVDPESGKLTF